MAKTLFMKIACFVGVAAPGLKSVPIYSRRCRVNARYRLAGWRNFTDIPPSIAIIIAFFAKIRRRWPSVQLVCCYLPWLLLLIVFRLFEWLKFARYDQTRRVRHAQHATGQTHAIAPNCCTVSSPSQRPTGIRCRWICKSKLGKTIQWYWVGEYAVPRHWRYRPYPSNAQSRMWALFRHFLRPCQYRYWSTRCHRLGGCRGRLWR